MNKISEPLVIVILNVLKTLSGENTQGKPRVFKDFHINYMHTSNIAAITPSILGAE